MTSARDNGSRIITAFFAAMKHAIAVRLIGDMDQTATDSDKSDRWLEIC